MSGSAGKKDDQGRWAAAVAALLAEPSIAAAATAVGVSEATVRRWLKLPKFLRLYRAARRAVVEAAVGRVQGATGRAIDTLLAALDCDKPATRVRAAELILELAVRGVELADVIGRVDELEKVLAEVKARGDREPAGGPPGAVPPRGQAPGRGDGAAGRGPAAGR